MARSRDHRGIEAEPYVGERPAMNWEVAGGNPVGGTGPRSSIWSNPKLWLSPRTPSTRPDRIVAQFASLSSWIARVRIPLGVLGGWVVRDLRS